MRIIDSHCHVGEGFIISQSHEKLLSDMDSNNVEMAVITPSDVEIAVDNISGNNNILSLARKYPDRFIPFATVNPWYGKKACDEIKRCRDMGAEGLKLAPHYQGFQITDAFVRPIVECAVNLKMPLYITTGIPVCAMPIQLTYLAGDYPEGIFIEGRYGWPDFWTDSIPSVINSPNIYADISYNAPSTVTAAIKTVGAERVLFSSDSPYLCLKNEVNKLMLTDMTKDDLELVMGKNILRILKRE